jgi:hypothetical protein
MFDSTLACHVFATRAAVSGKKGQENIFQAIYVNNLFLDAVN